MIAVGPRALDFRFRRLVVSFALTFGCIALIVPQGLMNRADALVCNGGAGDAGRGGIAEAFDDNPYVRGTGWDLSKGTYTTMWSPLKNSTPCQRVSSIYVQNVDGGGAEFGWIQGESSCDGQVYNKPTAFFWIESATGTHYCDVFSGTVPTQGDYVPFEVLVTSFSAKNYMNGVKIGGDHVVPFNQGISYVAEERGLTSDDCYAEWQELKEYHPTNSWTYWDDPHVTPQDASACNVTISGTHAGKDS